MAKQPQPTSRLKQYYVLKDHDEKNVGRWKKNEIIEIDPQLAVPYVGASILTPLATAISTGIIPPLNPSPMKEKAKDYEKEVFTATVDETPLSPPESTKKVIAKNTLKEAVQAKKAASQPEEEVVLTASNGEEVTAPPRELSDQEKAIQAKIAALKKGK